MRRMHTIVLAAALAALAASTALTPTAARAGDDGGGRSVFAYGAGNRALGLGGAFAGIANDASAPVWNPAGLGLIRRSEFQGSQTSYYDLDIDEQYASIVLPSWRYGVGSITLRHFGVGGIERRDERNVLLDDGLSNNETELSIGYGRSMGSFWSLGGVVKLRRQSIAATSGSGAGIDLGVIGKPLVIFYPNLPAARRLSVGVAVRNALEPRIKLVDESVPDPTGVRLGTALLIPVGDFRDILAAVDLEKTFRTNPRVHAGLEFAVHPLLTLRAGTSAGMLTAGSGVAWNSFTLNYTFEDNPLGGVHRIGLDVGLGATVDERRYAAEQAREDEMQTRLAQAFERRQSERVDELLGATDAAMREGRFEDALTRLGVVAALEPGLAGLPARQARCLIEIARLCEAEGDFNAASVSYAHALAIAPDNTDARDGLDSCRAESDRASQRTADLRRRFESSLDAFSRNDLAGARSGFESILETTPGDKEAAAMLTRTNEAIAQRVAAALEECDRLIEGGRFADAASRIDDVILLAPQSRGIANARSALAAARRRAQSDSSAVAYRPARASETETHVVTDAERKELPHLYENGVQAMDEERSQDAIRYLELVWSVDPLYQRVSEHLKREYLVRGMEFFASGKLDQAVVYWENARRIDPDDPRVLGYLSRAREQVARTKQILGDE